MQLNPVKTYHLRHLTVLLGMAALLTLGAHNGFAQPDDAAPTLSDTSITRLAKTYEAVSSALVADDLGLANAHAADLSERASDDGSPELADLAMAVATAKTLEAARTAFKPLSAAVIKLAKNQGQYVVMVCPMVADGHWLQSSTTTANPYMGQAMPNCGKPDISIRADGSKVAAADGCCGS
jgi:hypothetical protein